jgi:hypothetical protein
MQSHGCVVKECIVTTNGCRSIWAGTQEKKDIDQSDFAGR